MSRPVFRERGDPDWAGRVDRDRVERLVACVASAFLLCVPHARLFVRIPVFRSHPCLCAYPCMSHA
eukprot:10510383-Alexandrium_andersonii.AAC.1